MDSRSKQFADMRAQIKCQTCAHPHHQKKRIGGLPVRCNKPESNAGQQFRCPCADCTCQLCVLEELKRLKLKSTFWQKTLDDVKDDIDALTRKYPGDATLAEVRKTLKILLEEKS